MSPEKLSSAEIAKRIGVARDVTPVLSELISLKAVVRDRHSRSFLYGIRPGADVSGLVDDANRTPEKPPLVRVYKALASHSMLAGIATATGLDEHDVRKHLETLIAVRRVVKVGEGFGRVDGDSPLPGGILAGDRELDIHGMLARLRARHAAIGRAIEALEAVVSIQEAESFRDAVPA